MSPLLFALVMEPLAQEFQAITEVRGVQVGAREYKIALFADMLTNPMALLPKAMQPFEMFSWISGFKINIIKLEILNIVVDREDCLQLQESIPFWWVQRTIYYLGVQLTAAPEALYQANYDPLLWQVQKDLEQYLVWAHCNSQDGDIAMFLCLFQVPPVPLPEGAVVSW